MHTIPHKEYCEKRCRLLVRRSVGKPKTRTWKDNMYITENIRIEGEEEEEEKKLEKSNKIKRSIIKNINLWA